MSEKWEWMGSMRQVLLLVALASLPGVSPVCAQDDPFAPSESNAWGPTVNDVSLSIDSHAIWRGIELGSPGMMFDGDIGIYGFPVTVDRQSTPLGVSLRGTALGVFDERDSAPTGTRADLTVVVSRQTGSEGAYVEFLGTAYRAFDGESEPSGAEFGIGFGGVPIPFLPERLPTLDARLLRDIDRFDATHAEVGVTLDTPPIIDQSTIVELGVRVHADDYERRSFLVRSTQLQLGADYNAWRIGWRALILGGHVSWQHVRDGSNQAWAGVRIRIR